jgi:diguanylate cyclase (GGDEF)-like protein
VSQNTGVRVDYESLFERASLATTPAACEECLAEIGRALESVTAPAGQARLLMCRARVRSNQWRTAEVCEDARAAMTLFEIAGEPNLAVDAASLGAAHASRLGELSLASELATKSILALDSVTDDRLRVEIANRLGIFCYSFLDYDRAVDQFEASLAAAERTGDRDKVYRQLHNIADALLLASRQRRLSHLETGTERLDLAEVAVRRLLIEGTAEMNRQSGSHRLLAEVLCDLGHVDEALRVLDESRDQASAITPAAQRAALALVEARCLRLGGRVEEAVTAAIRAVRSAEASSDDHELMLALEELATAEEAAGDLKSALANAREAKARMWAIHQRQTKQLVQESWARADLERDHRRDRRDLQTQAAEASRLADEDTLTGIGTRRLLERFLRKEAARHTDVACIIVDVDHFKEINDTLGHGAGDAVLRRLGQLFLSETRAGQVAIRYGGDEFVLALPGVDLALAGGFAERLRLAVLGHDWATLAPGLRVTASLGVAFGPASRWQAILADSDALLYAAKQRGGNAVGKTSIGAHAARRPPPTRRRGRSAARNRALRDRADPAFGGSLPVQRGSETSPSDCVTGPPWPRVDLKLAEAGAFDPGVTSVAQDSQDRLAADREGLI